jgi:hypothetical protein
MRIALSFLAIATLTSCAGNAPPNQAGNPDAAVDGGDNLPAFELSGTIKDYFGGQTIDGAVVATDGLVPDVMALSAADGTYKLDVAAGSALFLITTKTGYRPTRNHAMTVADAVTIYDAYLMTEQDVRNQYTAVGALPVGGTAIVIADLRRNDGTPLEGIPLENIKLLDGNNEPVAGLVGPYFFNAAGSLDTALTTATAYQGRSRAALLDVPPGTYTLSVSYLDNENPVVIPTLLSTLADGGTLVLSGGAGGGGNNVPDPSFATHIYPKLQRAGEGGLGCANCHTLSGAAAVLPYDGLPATVLANITGRPGVVNPAVPAESLLLVRPLYELPPTPQDHPNATFLTTNDADYKLFLAWITNGAKP